jgi:hypothetical protein
LVNQVRQQTQVLELLAFDFLLEILAQLDLFINSLLKRVDRRAEHVCQIVVILLVKYG